MVNWSSNANRTLPLLLVVLVALAGCSGAPADASDGENDSSVAALDGGALANETATAVEKAGSYTIESRSQLASNDSIELRTQTVRVDVDAATGFRRSTSNTSRGTDWLNTTEAVYTEGAMSYEKEVRNDTFRENYTDYTATESQRPSIGAVEVSTFDHGFASAVDSFTWERTGETTFDGDTVVRYESTGFDRDGEFLSGAGTVSNVSGTLLVDESGVIRRIAVSGTLVQDGTERTVSLSTTLTDIGSTTVEQPAWFSKAAES